MNISLLYWNQIIFVVLLILLIYSFIGIRIEFDVEAKLYLFFWITILLPVVIYQVDYIRDVIKYFFYFVIYLFILRNYYNDRKYYSLFINFIVVYFVIAYTVFFFDVVLGANFFTSFPISDMTLPDDLSIIDKLDNDYYFPFYLYLVQKFQPITEMNLFGFLRFYGFSHEPTSFSMILLPLVFISIDLKKYIAVIILSIALFLVSSYAALILFVFFVLLYISTIVKNFKYVAILIILTSLVFYYDSILYYLFSFEPIQGRFYNYNEKLYYTYNFQFISSVSLAQNPYAASTANFITNTLRYGIINLVPVILILLFYLNKIKILKSKNKLFILIITFVMAQKGSYYFTPLILFYINYLNITDECSY